MKGVAIVLVTAAGVVAAGLAWRWWQGRTHRTMMQSQNAALTELSSNLTLSTNLAVDVGPMGSGMGAY